MLDELLHNTDLFLLYGTLLTDKQRECLSMHLLDDFSMSEIGEDMGISRQAAYDLIRRSIKSMEEYEAKLGFLKKRKQVEDILESVYDDVNKLDGVDAEMKKSLLNRLDTCIKHD
ncbi:MAG: YlxM family DNA-binding protein [Selenomonadaceae bacterium]